MEITRLIKKVTNWGVTPDLKVETAQIVRLTNIFGLFPMLVYISLITMGIILDISFYYISCSIITIVVAFGLWCNYKAYYSLSKTIIISSNSVLILLTKNVIEGNHSVIVYYFPILACFAFFYNLRKELKMVFLNLVITIACMAGCFTLPSHLFGRAEVGMETLVTISEVNYILAFLAFVFYIYYTTKVKLQTEALLIESRETAEMMARDAEALAKNAEQMADQLKIEKERAENDKKAKTIFLSNMSHELRTPLNGIIGTTNLLLQENRIPEISPQLDVLKYSSEHMLEVINDILDFNKIEAGKLQVDRNIFNLEHLVERLSAVFQPQFAKKNLNFCVEFDQRLKKEVISDDTRLNQILNNLISNALKFTRQGYVTLNVQLVSSTSYKMMVAFSVIDTGIGIPKNKITEVFKSFTQANYNTNREYGGTGLGLTISKKLVEMLGGEIKVKSTEGKGSQFSFTIPIRINNNKTNFVNEHKVKELKSLRGKKVLVAEDNKINMIVTKRFLEKWEVEIKEACNGLEALALFKEHEFDLLLIDLEMPVMDGYEAMTEIRKINGSIPAIAFTAAVFEDMKNRLIANGFNDYLNKPFRPEELHAKIAQYSARQEII
jgi:signal transduction histidine kinase/ActR/RegA family two-component response regulator